MLIAIEAAHANKERRTGVEEACWQIIQKLKEQIPSDVRVILYSNEPLRGELGILPSNWSARILRWPLKKLWSQIRLSWEFWRRPPDVFFAPGQLIPFFCPVKTIAIIHDSAFLAEPESYNFWGRQYLKWMNRCIIKKARKIITSSEFNKSEIIKYYGAAAGEKVTVIPFAYDDKKYCCHFRESGNPVVIASEAKQSNPIQCHSEFISESLSQKYNISQPFIISVGRLEKKKNTVNIIRAFNKIKSRDNIQYSILNIKLLLIGSPGVGYEEVVAEIDKSPYKNDIIQPGWVSDDDIPYLLNQASAFVFPSLYEGFGLPVLEAMACGCPVVAGDLPSLREVGGEAALYADPDSVEGIAGKILAVLNEEKRGEIIKSGLERARSFSWAKTAAGVLSVLLEQ